MGFFALDVAQAAAKLVAFNMAIASCAKARKGKYACSKDVDRRKNEKWREDTRSVPLRYFCRFTKLPSPSAFFSGGLDKLMEHLRHRFRKSNLKSMCFCKCLKLFLQHWSQHPHYGGQPLECCGHVLSWRKSEHFDMCNYILHNKPSMVASATSNGMIQYSLTPAFSPRFNN